MSALDDNVFMITFDADAIKEHYDGADDDDLIEGLTDDDLQRAGVLAKDWFQSEDGVWQAFHECIAAAVREIRERKT